MTEVFLNSEQLDLIIMTLLTLSCSLALCLGFLANEMGGK